jgi:hypothetical protein
MAGKPAVRSKSAASAAEPMPARGRMTSAVLRQERYRSQQEQELCDHKRPMHAPIICPTGGCQGRIWCLAQRELGQYPNRPLPLEVYRFLVFAFSL